MSYKYNVYKKGVYFVSSISLTAGVTAYQNMFFFFCFFFFVVVFSIISRKCKSVMRSWFVLYVFEMEILVLKTFMPG